MGIEEITNIKNYGRFKNTSPIKFENNTVFFGFNGMGKSTISSIFYSLANSDKESLITNRRRLKEKETDEDEDIFIEVKTQNDVYTFSGDKWNKRLNSYTFNGDYVSDNVIISNVTKRAGTYSVELGSELTKLDLKRQNHEKTIDKDLIIKLNDIFARYNHLIKVVAATGVAKSIKRKSANMKKVSEIKLYPASKKAEVEKSIGESNKYEILSRKISAITESIGHIPLTNIYKVNLSELKDTLRKKPSITNNEIIIHMNKHFKKHNVSWLLTGMYLNKNETKCPYCGQDLIDEDSVKFINALKLFANRKRNEKAKDLKDKALSFLKKIDIDIIIESIKLYYSIIEELRNKKLLTLKDYTYYFRDDKNISNDILISLCNKIKLKIDDPFEEILLTEKELQCLYDVNMMIDKIGKLKSHLKAIENKINMRKTTDKETEKIRSLAELSFGIMRAEIEEMISSAQKILKLEKDIEEIELLQIDLRENIHLGKISQYLKELNTKFSIIKENGRFYLKIRDFEERVLYDTNNDVRSKYILSEGDQRALAFAYFLFDLDQHRNETNKIIVFDDPISSLDLSRKSIIAYIIAEEMRNNENQVIVLSHDISFIEKLQHFYSRAKYYIFTNSDQVVEELNVKDYILSDEEIYKKFIGDAVKYNSYNNTVIALMALRPLYETVFKGINEIAPTYKKYATYFNHSIYAKLDGYNFQKDKYKTDYIRKYFRYIKRKVGFEYKAEDVVPENFSFNGFDYKGAVKLYQSIPLNNIANSRKKALMLRVLLEVLMVQLSNDFNLRCKDVWKYYNRNVKKFKKGTEDYGLALKIMEAYNQTKKFHHGADAGSMLGISWVNPDEIEYYDSIINNIISYLELRRTDTTEIIA